ncbi:Putative mutator protein MutT4 [Planctomycetes bacterium Pla163]|uniref:Mutator protein MutT4 n=1 Tax=Rohdeia mirabilis TaxID=2528008 RepID=A0A518D0G7_9BACT|nr:Putative mutator protein MutT4 [Planctomycetes bacterium Pla163]
MWSKVRYCPACAAPLESAPVFGRERLRCPACAFVLFANPVGAAGAVVVDPDRRILLVRRAIAPHAGSWALPAGYQEIDESPSGAAEREVREETGVTIRTVALLDLVFVPDDPRKPANVALFLAIPVAGEPSGRDDALDADWFALDDLPRRLAFESNHRILERLAKASDESRGWWASWRAALDDSNETDASNAGTEGNDRVD